MASPAPANYIGEVVAERYHIQQQLGRTAGRRTLLARDLQTDSLVVVKLLLFGPEFEWADLKLFEREAKILQTLSHPAIPRYLHHFELEHPNGKGFALVQSYIEARSLADQIKTGTRFSEADIHQVAKALLDILVYLHQQHPPVIHRDIKPSNILLGVGEALPAADRSPDPTIYLVDFGSVQTLAAAAADTITVVGTYGYMPPEQFGGRTVPASDLYSLGATLIYLLTGEHPADLPQTELRIEFESRVQVSPAFARWLKRLIEPSLDRRFSSATAALQALKALNQPGDEAALVSIQPPAGSKVVLQRTATRLDVLLPPTGFSNDIATLSLFAIVLNTCAIVLAVGLGVNVTATAGAVSTLLYLLLFSMWSSVSGIIVAALLMRTQLRIDPQTISLLYRGLGLVYRRRLGQSQDICKLIYARRSPPDDRQPRLILWTGTQKFEFGTTLSDPELDWLAQELSDWLGLPVTQD